MSNTNEDVKHIWANRSRAYARSSNGNISCVDASLVSYNTVIAKHVYNARGDHGVVISQHWYSVTTGTKHLSRLSNRIPAGIEVMYVERVENRLWPESATNELTRHVDLYQAEYTRQKNTRNPDFYALQLLHQRMLAFAKFWDLPIPAIDLEADKAALLTWHEMRHTPEGAAKLYDVQFTEES